MNEFTLNGVKKVFNHKFDEIINYKINKKYYFSFEISPNFSISIENNIIKKHTHLYREVRLERYNSFQNKYEEVHEEGNDVFYFKTYLKGLKIENIEISTFDLDYIEIFFSNNAAQIESLHINNNGKFLSNDLNLYSIINDIS